MQGGGGVLVLFKITSFVNLYYVSHKYCSPIHKLRVQDRPVPKYFQQKYFLPKVGLRRLTLAIGLGHKNPSL